MSNIILCGVGGQGTVLASRLLSAAAMERGMAVKAAETIGMAQRGGSVLSHVRLGKGAHAPLVGDGRADLIIAFEPAEAVRHLGSLKPGGAVVTSNRPVVPVSSAVGGPAYNLEGYLSYLARHVDYLVVVDAAAAEKDLGNAKCLNVVLLGAACHADVLGFSSEDIADAIKRLVPERFQELNARALAWAAEHASATADAEN